MMDLVSSREGGCWAGNGKAGEDKLWLVFFSLQSERGFKEVLVVRSGVGFICKGARERGRPEEDASGASVGVPRRCGQVENPIGRGVRRGEKKNRDGEWIRPRCVNVSQKEKKRGH